ncbi:MAG TPA: hypothetical protein P5079_09000 [Elusimicrobiota bacterium]|nr:hypothetical protein [Elusimicrobiota bacterium]
MRRPPIKLFLVDESVRHRPNVCAFLRNYPRVPVKIVPAGQTIQALLTKKNISPDRTVYSLAEPKGKNLKKCQGMTEHYLCCQLHILDQSENCPFSCSYCFLQNYLSQSITAISMRFDPLFKEVQETVGAEPRRLFRIGTGELSDSLALDPLTGFSRKAVPFFSSLPNALLELKTKSDRVEQLLNLHHGGRTVISWTLNPPAVARREERGAASPSARLEAARKTAAAGYKIAFHFDPLIHYPGFEKDYALLVRQMFDAVPVEKIAWVSLGSLRYPPEMQQTVLDRFPGSGIAVGEMVRGYDGKMRYFKPIRHRLYETLRAALEGGGAGLFLYFCMENAETWRKFLGWAPKNNADFDFRFARHLCRKFPGLMPAPPKPDDYRVAPDPAA